jgi:putative Mg2+ transporter-C (MgtC) family protein
MRFASRLLLFALSMALFADGVEALTSPQRRLTRHVLAMVHPSTNLFGVLPTRLQLSPQIFVSTFRIELGRGRHESKRYNDYVPVQEKGRANRFIRKHWAVFLLFAISALILPTRSASALQEGATMLLQEGGYSSNAPISILHVASSVSLSAQLRFTGRLVYAALLGGTVGLERSGKEHHPAGVRTMALVSLGAATFTLCSMYGFSAAGRCDPSRMASNVASGVGFIGAGVITTTAGKSESEGGGSIVHGLTTAAAIWLSAAVGVGCGVGMCVLSTAAALLTITVLRIGRVAQDIEQAKRKLSLRPAPSSAAQQVYEDPLLLRALRRDKRRSLKPKHSETYKFKETIDEPFQHDLDLYEEREDQLIFHDQRPESGWNETDQMDA